MTPTDIAPIAANARRQLRAGLTACILQADQVAELTADYAKAVGERDAARARLAEIERIMPTLLLAWCGCDREAERELMERIVGICQTGP